MAYYIFVDKTGVKKSVSAFSLDRAVSLVEETTGHVNQLLI